MKYLWTEDTGAGLHFWKLVNQLFFENALVVESKESNQGILNAVSDLRPEEEDKYYIAFDYVVDNFAKNFPDSKIELNFVAEIPKMPSGKDDYCVSEYDFSGK